MKGGTGGTACSGWDLVAFQKRIARRWLELGYSQAEQVLKLLEAIPSGEVEEPSPMADFADVVALMTLTPEGITIGWLCFKFPQEVGNGS